MRRSGIAFGGVCAITTAFAPGAGMAQDGGVLLTFGIENRLEIVRNDALSVPGTGTDLSNSTALSFGLTTETAIDRLTFSATGAAIVEDTAGLGTEFDFGQTEVALEYHREVPAAVLDLTAELRRDDVGTFDELADVDETGTRTDYAVGARLETGRTSVLGLAVGAGYARTEYQDASDPDLVDSTEVRGDAAIVLHFSEVATGRLGLRYSQREEESPGTTVTESVTSFAGLDYSVSERLDLSAELGYSEIETEDFDVVDRVTGPDLRLGATYDLAVGTASAVLSVSQDSDEGQRTTFEIGRDYETPRTAVSARLGVTRSDATGSDLTGSLTWTRQLPDGSLGLEIARRVTFDDDADEAVDTSTVAVNWLKTLNDVSTISLEVAYEARDSASESIDQVTFGAGYTQRLTQDWNLDSGVTYRVRDDADGRATSPGLFVALSREFQLRP
jgi:hypothetical protein